VKKIVLFNNTLSGGAGNSILTLAKALVKSGIDVSIVIYKNRVDYPVPPEIPLYVVRPKGPGKTNTVRAVGKQLETIGPFDAVISNSSPSNKILSALHLPKAFHIVRSSEAKEYRGILGPAKDRWRRKKYIRLYSGKHIITISKGLERYILDTLKAVPTSITTIYNPFDFEMLRKMADIPDTEIPDTPFLLHVGRFDISSKRHDLLLEAYKKSGIEYPLYLLGKGPDRERIQKIVAQLDLSDNVFMPGYRSNPYTWIQKAKLLIFSSDFEGFGRVLVEALALGTPVVSTDCPNGPSEILTGELRKFLTPTGDPTGLAKSIVHALESYPVIDDRSLERFRDTSIAEQLTSWLENPTPFHKR
jgi:glycosyltransferase involved in cell wall biosynthesis